MVSTLLDFLQQNSEWLLPMLLGAAGLDMTRLTTTCKCFGSNDWFGLPCTHASHHDGCSFCELRARTAADIDNGPGTVPHIARCRRGQCVRLVLLYQWCGPLVRTESTLAVKHLFSDDVVGNVETLESCEVRLVVLLRGAGVPHLEGWGTDDGSGVLIKRDEFPCHGMTWDDMGIHHGQWWGNLDFDVSETWNGRGELLAAYLTWTKELRNSVRDQFVVDWRNRFAETDVEIIAANPITPFVLLRARFAAMTIEILNGFIFGDSNNPCLCATASFTATNGQVDSLEVQYELEIRNDLPMKWKYHGSMILSELIYPQTDE